MRRKRCGSAAWTPGRLRRAEPGLPRLNDLLVHETEALRLRGVDAGQPQNVEAVRLESGRVKGLAAPKSQNSFGKNVRTEQRQIGWHNAPQNSGRNRGRRTMGRA